jgi:UDP-N-acetylglucosamine 2-epimerase
MMKFLSVVGARPEFVQAMPVSQLLHTRYNEVLVHTGQHYDYRMSQLFSMNYRSLRRATIWRSAPALMPNKPPRF